jgi:hypothetical protein
MRRCGFVGGRIRVPPGGRSARRAGACDRKSANAIKPAPIAGCTIGPWQLRVTGSRTSWAYWRTRSTIARCDRSRPGESSSRFAISPRQAGRRRSGRGAGSAPPSRLAGACRLSAGDRPDDPRGRARGQPLVAGGLHTRVLAGVRCDARSVARGAAGRQASRSTLPTASTSTHPGASPPRERQGEIRGPDSEHGGSSRVARRGVVAGALYDLGITDLECDPMNWVAKAA